MAVTIPKFKINHGVPHDDIEESSTVPGRISVIISPLVPEDVDNSPKKNTTFANKNSLACNGPPFQYLGCTRVISRKDAETQTEIRKHLDNGTQTQKDLHLEQVLT